MSLSTVDQILQKATSEASTVTKTITEIVSTEQENLWQKLKKSFNTYKWISFGVLAAVILFIHMFGIVIAPLAFAPIRILVVMVIVYGLTCLTLYKRCTGACGNAKAEEIALFAVPPTAIFGLTQIFVNLIPVVGLFVVSIVIAVVAYTLAMAESEAALIARHCEDDEDKTLWSVWT